MSALRNAVRNFRCDVDRFCMRPRSRVVTVLTTQGLWAMAVQRMFHELLKARGSITRRAAHVLCRVLEKLIQVTAGMQIPAECEIGRGLYIGHFGSVVLSPRVQIGENCNLSQGVTIGSGGRGDREGVPIIGDRVWIGPGAVLFGPIEIGDDVAIGANAVVNRSLPPRCVAAGVPARIVSYAGSFDYVQYRGMENDPARLASLAMRMERGQRVSAP